MKRPWIFAGLLTALLFVLVFGGPEARASNAIAQKQGLNCTVCHDKPGSKLLTDRGKYYEALGSLEGYDSVVTFAACTDCHTRKPGSHKLTRTGKRFADVVHDMEGLRAWLQKNHPMKGTEPPTPQP
jgi:formate-dependent nitrite reductase cytochrome c552 subunit